MLELVAGSVSILLSIAGGVLYVKDIYMADVRPKTACWLIWTILTGTVFVAQLVNGGGLGSWTTGVVCITCFATTIISLKRGDNRWRLIDRVSLGSSIIAIIIWVMTGNSVYSVVILTIVELLGFIVMSRKTWENPKSESLGYYGVALVKYVTSIVAMNVWNIETLLYPASTTIMVGVFMAMIVGRRIKIGAGFIA